MLASQGQLSDLTKKFDGRTPNNSSKLFLLGQDGTVKDSLLLCLEKYNINDREALLPYYSLFESRNGSSIDGCLSLETTMSEVIQSWIELGCDKTAKFLFMVRLYMPSVMGIQFKDVVEHRLGKTLNNTELFLHESETTDPNALFLQFIQAVYHVITGRYPTTAEEAIDLGAIHFLFKFNEYKPASHKVGFLGNRIVEFIPVKHLKSGVASSIEEWEEKLFDRVEYYANEALPFDNKPNSNGEPPVIPYFHRNGVPITPVRQYMDKIYAMHAVYGNTFFRCSQRCVRSLPENPYVGVNHHGLSIFDKNKKLIRTFSIEEIYRWGFKPNTMFYFEVSVEENPELGTGSLEFETSEGKVISDLLTDYAMAFLKEREMRDERQAKLPRLSSTAAAVGKAAGASTRSSTSAPAAAAAADANGKEKRKSVNKDSSKTTNRSSTSADGRRASTGKKSASQKAKEDKAVVKIQALFRGFSLRNEWCREDASILIQSVFRGYRARVALTKMIEQMIHAGQL